jgi:predicted ArsR family transcriptional regulator
MCKRIISQREETAYRLCHQDFDGLPVDHAATRMGISRKAVLRLLKNVERKAPQLTPVLTPSQRLILMLTRDSGQTPKQISATTALSEEYIRRIIRFLEARGFIMPKAKTVGYTPALDSRIVE